MVEFIFLVGSFLVGVLIGFVWAISIVGLFLDNGWI